MIGGMVNLLFGCRHRKITRPITPVHKIHEEPEPTYVACLECGKRLHYDLDNMRVGKPVVMAESSYPAEPYR
jgi:hypothetical protein